MAAAGLFTAAASLAAAAHPLPQLPDTDGGRASQPLTRMLEEAFSRMAGACVDRRLSQAGSSAAFEVPAGLVRQLSQGSTSPLLPQALSCTSVLQPTL